MALIELFSTLPSLSTSVLAGILVLGYIFWTIHSYIRLSHIPGPWYAALSNVPRLYWVWTRQSHVTHLALHAKYGPLVRLGPNVISVADPDEIPTIYTFTGTFAKVRAGAPFLFLFRGTKPHSQISTPCSPHITKVAQSR
jgi:hypothetical protein